MNMVNYLGSKGLWHLRKILSSNVQFHFRILDLISLFLNLLNLSENKIIQETDI